MDSETTDHEDVAEPGQGVSGTAGTGQEHGIQTGGTGTQETKNPHSRVVIGLGALYNGKVLPRFGTRHTVLVPHGKVQRVPAIWYFLCLTATTGSGTGWKKRSSGWTGASQNSKTGGGRNDCTQVK